MLYIKYASLLLFATCRKHLLATVLKANVFVDYLAFKDMSFYLTWLRSLTGFATSSRE